MNKKVIWLMSSVLLLGFSSCGKDIKPVCDLSTSVTCGNELGKVEQQKPVSILNAQLLAVSASSAKGALKGQSVGNTYMSTILVSDFDNQPFYYLNLLSKYNYDFWSSLSKAEENNTDYEFVGTGASTDRNLLAFMFNNEFGKKLLELSKTIKISKLVSPQGAEIYAQDDSGQYWDISSGKTISEAVITEQKNQYHKIRDAYFSQPSEVKDNRSVWEKMSEKTSGLTGSLTVNSKLNTLSLKSLSSATQAPIYSGSGITSQALDDDLVSSGWWGDKDRVGMVDSPVPASQLNTWSNSQIENSAGYKQRYDIDLLKDPSNAPYGSIANLQHAGEAPYNISLSTHPNSASSINPKWSIRHFNPLDNTALLAFDNSSGMPIGCISATILRLITINSQTGNLKSKFADGLNSRYQKNNTGLNLLSMYRDMAKPVIAEGISSPDATYFQPYITKVFGAGELHNDDTSGILITPHGFRDGLPTILNDTLGSGFTSVGGIRGNFLGLAMDSNYFYGSYESWTHMIKDAVRQTIGIDNNPVVFLYSSTSNKPGAFGIPNTNNYIGHLAPAFAYKIHENWLYADVFVYKDTKKDASGRDAEEGFFGGYGTSGWISVTNRWQVYQGAVGLR